MNLIKAIIIKIIFVNINPNKQIQFLIKYRLTKVKNNNEEN